MKRWLLKQFGYNAVLVPTNPQTMVSNEGVRTVEAFMIDGVKYFQFADPFNVTTGRYFATIAAYEELQMRCDKEYLEAHTKATEEIINNPKGFKLTWLAKINENLKERMELMPTADFIYRLASVLFFDESESAHVHDYAYAAKKIERWKQHRSTLDFFLSRPLKSLMPSLNISTENSQMYLEVAEKLDKIHRGYITSLQSAS